MNSFLVLFLLFDFCAELIFGRFGALKKVEIIRDRRTNESLGYGFVHFETKEACVAAYTKMDNVMVDEKRIHVDFCQSVPKLWQNRLFGVALPADLAGEARRREAAPKQHRRSPGRDRRSSPEDKKKRQKKSRSRDRRSRSRSRLGERRPRSRSRSRSRDRHRSDKRSKKERK